MIWYLWFYLFKRRLFRRSELSSPMVNRTKTFVLTVQNIIRILNKNIIVKFELNWFRKKSLSRIKQVFICIYLYVHPDENRFYCLYLDNFFCFLVWTLSVFQTVRVVNETLSRNAKPNAISETKNESRANLLNRSSINLFHSIMLFVLTCSEY